VCDVPLEAGRVNQGLVVDGWECRGSMGWAIDRENGLGQISWQVLVRGP
jgi:hypothetical protein